MEGSQHIFIGLLVIVLSIATLTDFTQRKIYNWLTYPSLVAGLMLNLFFHGLNGLGGSLVGLLLGAALFFPAFYWGGMGAGDIKLMAVVGAFMGWNYALNAACYTAFAGGVLAVGILLRKGELWHTLKRLACCLRSLFIPQLEIEPLSRKYSLSYAVIISIGTILAYFFPLWVNE